MKEKYALAIDIGGTKLRIGLVSEAWELIDLFVTQEHQSFSPQQLVIFMAKNVKSFINRHSTLEIIGIGVGYPGPFNHQDNSTFSYCNLRDPSWERVPLAEMIANETNFPVYVDNDANLAGLAELHIGAGKNFKNLVYITISTGTGGAIFINRQLYRGFLGSAGEFGHMIVDINGVRCKCGNQGCLMSLLSGLGIEKLIEREPSCQLLFSDGERSNDCIQKLIELSVGGNSIAQEIMKPIVDYFSVALLNIIHLLNPEAIIVGGGLGKALMQFFLPTVQQYLRENLPKEVINQTQILEASLGDQNGILGGAILVFENLLNNQPYCSSQQINQV